MTLTMFTTQGYGTHALVPVQVVHVVPDSGSTDCKHDHSVLVTTGARTFYRRLSELKRIDDEVDE
jgi:hypothetical protein